MKSSLKQQYLSKLQVKRLFKYMFRKMNIIYLKFLNVFGKYVPIELVLTKNL